MINCYKGSLCSQPFIEAIYTMCRNVANHKETQRRTGVFLFYKTREVLIVWLIEGLWLSVSNEVLWLSVSNEVLWLSVSNEVLWLSVSNEVLWLSVSNEILWLSVNNEVLWLSVNSEVLWLSVSNEVLWLSVSHEVLWLSVSIEVLWLSVSVLHISACSPHFRKKQWRKCELYKQICSRIFPRCMQFFFHCEKAKSSRHDPQIIWELSFTTSRQ